MNKIIMIMGFPASGKSTVTKEYIAQGFVNLNRDTEGGTIKDLLPKLENLLKDNKDVVLDNLFPTIEVRKPFIKLAKKYQAAIEAIIMDTSMEDAQFNFCQRMIDICGEILGPNEIKKHKHPSIFPIAVFYKYRKEFQKPSTDQGFDSVITHHFERKVNPNWTQKALICDFDGTLRECVGGNGKFPTEKEHVKILENRIKVLKEYEAKGYKLLGLSNQSGIHKGDLTSEKTQELFDYTNELLGLDIDTKFCSHQSSPLNCYCRKPNAAYIVHFQRKYNLDLKNSIFVGDWHTDIGVAKRSGMQYIDQAEFFK